MNEWTPKFVADMVEGNRLGWGVVADAHNAELAAERDRHSDSCMAVDRAELLVLQEKVSDLEKQLADEREAWKTQVVELAKTLAAEREKAEGVSKWYLERIDALNKVNDGLSGQLDDADREKVQTLVDALKEIWVQTLDEDAHRIADSALAKVGTYPLPNGRTK